MRLLVAEDEIEIANQLKSALSAEGFAVDLAPDGTEALFMGLEYPIDMAVIDIGLPHVNGIEVIKKLRAEGKTYPILVLTARGKWQDKVEGLEAGADDYLVKPFHLEELVARLNALKRRASGMAHAIIEKGPIQVDTNLKRVTLHNDEVSLTAFEYRILEYMMLRDGKIISKAELTDHIYDENVDHDSNVIEVFVGRLRKKIDPSCEHKPIATIRGQGYRFNLA
jgi:two-component system response regulator PhoP